MLEMTVVACLFMRELIFLTEEQFTGKKMNSLHKTLNVTSSTFIYETIATTWISLKKVI